jgi:hypothetical protein
MVVATAGDNAAFARELNAQSPGMGGAILHDPAIT